MTTVANCTSLIKIIDILLFMKTYKIKAKKKFIVAWTKGKYNKCCSKDNQNNIDSWEPNYLYIYDLMKDSFVISNIIIFIIIHQTSNIIF